MGHDTLFLVSHIPSATRQQSSHASGWTYLTVSWNDDSNVTCWLISCFCWKYSHFSTTFLRIVRASIRSPLHTSCRTSCSRLDSICSSASVLQTNPSNLAFSIAYNSSHAALPQHMLSYLFYRSHALPVIQLISVMLCVMHSRLPEFVDNSNKQRECVVCEFPFLPITTCTQLRVAIQQLLDE